MQSILESQAAPPLHVAIVMDGNGRWGTRRGLDRSAGHRAGAETVERIVEAAADLGIGVLTLFAFSSDNWRRPRPEVAALMQLLRRYVRRETSRFVENGVRLSVVGRRDRLPPRIVRAIEHAERVTRAGTRLHLRIALDYSARDAIARAARRWATSPSPSLESLGALITQGGDGPPIPDVDLLVRTGGEQRLSDFLLWECAYAELYFTDRLWPDFTADDLAAALVEFRRRERRFGDVVAAPAPPSLVTPIAAAPPVAVGTPTSPRERIDSFRTRMLDRLRATRTAPGRLATRALHTVIFVGTMLVVGLGHRAVSRASGQGVRGFWRATWDEYRRDLAGMRPPPVPVAPGVGAAPLDPTPLAERA